MPLTLTGKKSRPTVEGKPVGQTGKNDGDGSLEARPILPRPKPHDQMTVRTSVAPQEQGFGKAIEISFHKTMPPDPSMAPRTVRRPWPRKKLALFENLLDADIHSE
jgi:hypothetical protein